MPYIVEYYLSYSAKEPNWDKVKKLDYLDGEEKIKDIKEWRKLYFGGESKDN
jgi:hypothetical protein